MRTVILGNELHEIECEDKDIATPFPLVKGQVDAMNHLLSRQLNADIITMVSGVFAFKDSATIRYRRVFRSEQTRLSQPLVAPTLMANDVVLNNLLIRWKHEGKGDAVICYSKRMTAHSANIREMYPYREGDMYFFYNGRYGTGELWNDVRSARTSRTDIPEAVFKKYSEHVKIGNFERKLNGYDNETFRDCILYEHPDDGAIPRAYRAFVWKDGEVIHDDTYSDGYSANFRMSNLRHRYIEYISDGELDESSSWRCY